MTASAAAVLRAEAKFRWPTLQYHYERIDRLKGWLAWSHRRVRSIYNAEEGVSLRGVEALRIAEIKAEQDQRKREAQEANDALKRSQENYRALEARIAALEALFVGGEAELDSERMALARAVLGGSVQAPARRGR